MFTKLPNNEVEGGRPPLRTSWLRPVAVISVVFTLACILHWRLRGLLFDDAFIHLRIARHLTLTGKAFFNPGERVMATSSPVWTILLAATGASTHPWAVPLLEAAIFTACGTLTFLLAKSVLPLAAKAKANIRAAQVALLAMVVILPVTAGQMETPLALTLLLAAAFSYTRGSGLYVPLIALAACTRLELVPFFMGALVLTMWQGKHRKALLIAIGIVLTIFAAVFGQFGVVLPNSMRAKTIGYGYRHMDSLVQVFDSSSSFIRNPLAVCVVVVILCITADYVVSSRRHNLRQSTLVAAFCGAAGILTILGYVIRRTPVFEWYRPLIWLPLLLCFVLYRASENLPRWLRTIAYGASSIGVVTLMLLPMWKSALLLKIAITGGRAAEVLLNASDSVRVREYLAVGKVLHAQCPQGKLLAPEIGALGWAFDGYVYDAFGLASPRALAFHPLTSGAPRGGIPSGFVAEVQPDIIVSYTILDVEVRNNPELMRLYSLIALPATLPADRSAPGWHGSTHLDVLLRRGGACALQPTEQALRVVTESN